MSRWFGEKSTAADDAVRRPIRVQMQFDDIPSRYPEGAMASESLHLTIVYEQDENDLIVASVPEVPGAHSQGHTMEEARENVLDALRGLLELRASGYELTGNRLDSESLEGGGAFRAAGVPVGVPGWC